LCCILIFLVSVYGTSRNESVELRSILMSLCWLGWALVAYFISVQKPPFKRSQALENLKQGLRRPVLQPVRNK
jgi:hypothetical protein